MTAPTYRSEQAEDGTWTIYDVPVFSAHVRKIGGSELEFSEKWLRGAVAKAQTRHAEGYFHPAHVRHHGDTDDVQAAGKVRFRRVGQLRIGGQQTPTIFADLIGVPQATYDAIRRGELSYRSVEILDVASGEIDSLAFLDHEVPFFRYPLLRVAGEDVTTTQPARSAALAYSAAGASHAALFRYAEDAMTDEPEDKPEAMQAADPKQAAREALSQIGELLGKLAEALGLNSEVPAEEAPEAPPAPPMQAAAGPVEQPAAYAADARTQGQIDALSAKLVALEAKAAKAEQEAALVRYSASLAAEGFTADQVKAFEKVAREKGETAGLAYAEALRSVGPATPPATWTGELPVVKADAPEVAAYAAKGPAALTLAREIAATHKRTGSTRPLKDYLAVGMAAELEG